ncbi:MAG: hypothetical protein ACI8Z1_001267, partial [Candidatus Azotimanducaceae bacterium]
SPCDCIYCAVNIAKVMPTSIFLNLLVIFRAPSESPGGLHQRGASLALLQVVSRDVLSCTRSDMSSGFELGLPGRATI